MREALRAGRRLDKGDAETTLAAMPASISPEAPRRPSGLTESDLAELADLRARLESALAQNQALRGELRRVETELRVARLVIAGFNAEHFAGA
jgi:hypothetical protein